MFVACHKEESMLQVSEPAVPYMQRPIMMLLGSKLNTQRLCRGQAAPATPPASAHRQVWEHVWQAQRFAERPGAAVHASRNPPGQSLVPTPPSQTKFGSHLGERPSRVPGSAITRLSHHHFMP